MRKLRLTIGVAIVIVSFLVFFYNTLWFWFSNPELTQMQILIQKWPWMVLVIVASVLAMWILPEDKPYNNAIARELLPRRANGGKVPPPPKANVTNLGRPQSRK